jgi:hypothetical protein
MGQLLVMLIVPPIVGLVTYIVVRLIWERDENGAREAIRRRNPSAGSLTETGRVYATLNQSDDTTVVVFGDGTEGARLPPSQGNNQASYRGGSPDSRGNVPARPDQMAEMTDIEKERQIEKELDAASDRAEELLKNILNPKLLPLVMKGARATSRWIPRSLALWIARKINEEHQR